MERAPPQVTEHSTNIKVGSSICTISAMGSVLPRTPARERAEGRRQEQVRSGEAGRIPEGVHFWLPLGTGSSLSSQWANAGLSLYLSGIDIPASRCRGRKTKALHMCSASLHH